MPVVRGIVVAFVGAVLVFAIAASQSAPANSASLISSRQALQQPSEMVWAKAPYCACFLNSSSANVDRATANVAAALEKAKLAVTLKDQGPRDGWMYFVATFDPHSATREQVSAAIVAGGGQVLDSPP